MDPDTDFHAMSEVKKNIKSQIFFLAQHIFKILAVCGQKHYYQFGEKFFASWHVRGKNKIKLGCHFFSIQGQL